MPFDVNEEWGLGDLGKHEAVQAHDSLGAAVKALVEKPSEFNLASELGDLAENETIKDFTTVQDLAKALLNAPAAPELPADVDGYKLPENTAVKGLRKLALDNKVTQGQLDAFLKFHADTVASSVVQDATARKEGLKALKQEWGTEFEGRVATAKKAIAYFDKEGELNELLKQAKRGDDARMIKFMDSVGALLKEDGLIKSDNNVNNISGKSHADRMFPSHAK